MSYTVRNRSRARRRSQEPMSGFMDVIGQIASSVYGVKQPPSAELECLNKANASPQVAAIDAQIQQLAANWHPTGYYSPVDIANLLETLATQAAAAGDALAAAPSSTSDAESAKRDAFADAGRRYQDRVRPLARAVAEAQRTGANVIDAPTLKDIVISSMLAISNVYVTATVLQCRQSWVEKWLDKAYQAMAAIGAVAYRIIGVALKVGDQVINAAEGLAGILKYVIWGGVAVGGYMLYNEFRR